MFYTRIPCPRNTPYSPEDLNKATVYFPVIGWIAGALAGVVFYFSAQVFSTFTAALLSTIATVLLTGAFHEDGFADSCDGFGGGWTREKILTIMKDSRIGVYGALGLALLLLLKLSLLDDLFFLNGYLRGELWIVVLIFVTAHTLSRYMACVCIYFGEYARDNDDVGAKAKPMGQGMSGGGFFVTTTLALMPLALLIEMSHRGEFALALPLMLFVTWRAFAYFKKWVGGYTGDCLGAVQQVTEVMFFVCVVALL